jgi:membrane peptidoglycan carboxypeptidase
VRVDRLSDVPAARARAVVAIEDSRFYDHRGVDVKGSVRAAVRNGLSGEVEQGGSTLTQQYVKNALLAAAQTDASATPPPRSPRAQAARGALRARARAQAQQGRDPAALPEHRLLRQRRARLGTAADFYFTRSVRTLTLAQGALLAGIVQSPARLDPVDHPEAALARRNWCSPAWSRWAC